MIGLVDYGMGNLRSVEKALAQVGGEVQIVRTREALINSEAAVLPGVGAFGDCLRNLGDLELAEAVGEFVASGRPFLGICLGLQCLFDSSDESPGIPGLGIFRGTVPRFPLDPPAGSREPGWKVPHMGWNRIRVRRADCPLLEGVAKGSYVYFVHSYYCVPADPQLSCATTEYGLEFCSMIWKDNVYATQFHPEKSQRVGLQLLRNFVKRAGKGGTGT